MAASVLVDDWLIGFMTLRCRIGLHHWEKEVPETQRELIRETGYVGFTSLGVQKGWQNCRDCPCRRKVYRLGYIGLGGGRSGRWRLLYPAQEDYIDGMPVL